MIRAVIIDDDNDCRISLAYDIKQYCRDISIVGQADGVINGIELINSVNPDLIFLDVQMQDGSGFDLLEYFTKSEQYLSNTKNNFKVIFTTAYDKFAIKAIKFSAIDYLLKPIVSEELISAVKKFQNNTNHSQFLESINVLTENRKNEKFFLKKIALNTGGAIEIFRLNDIIRCESQSNYSKFYLVNKRSLLISKTLKEFDDLLSEQGFFRVHNSHLINMEHVSKFIKSEGGTIIMDDGSNVPMSRNKKDEFLKML